MTTDFDHKDDYLVRRAWELLDPLRDMEVPPMTVTAAELRRRAEQRHHGPRAWWLWHQRALMTRKRMMTLVTAGVALVVAVGAVVFTVKVAAQSGRGRARPAVDGHERVSAFGPCLAHRDGGGSGHFGP